MTSPDEVKVLDRSETAAAQAQFEAFGVPEGQEDDEKAASIPVDEPYVAPKAKYVVEHEEGVYVGGEWWTPGNGCSFAVRRYVRALVEGAGLAVRVDPAPKIDEEMNDWSPLAMADCGDLRNTRMKREIVRINFVVPHQHLERSMYPAICDVDREMRLRYEAIHHRFITFVWLERDRLSFREADMLSRCGQVWVACQSNADAVIRSGVPEEKVRVVPHPYDPRNPLLTVRKTLPERDQPYIFYSIGKWEPRKNQPALIEAFLLAFTPGQNVVLQMKTSGFGEWDGFPRNYAACLATLLARPDIAARGWSLTNVSGHIRVVSQHLTDAQLVQYHLLGHCHVSASHGEAWDLPAWDAFMVGNALVNASKMGHEEYDEHAGEMEEFPRFEPVHPQYGWNADARWESVSAERLAECMAFEFQERFSVDPPRRWREDVLDRLTYANMGVLMRKYIQEVDDAARLIEGVNP